MALATRSKLKNRGAIHPIPVEPIGYYGKEGCFWPMVCVGVASSYIGDSLLLPLHIDYESRTLLIRREFAREGRVTRGKFKTTNRLIQ